MRFRKVSSATGPGLKSKYAIARVIGNELPPRDVPGSRVQILKFILENEYIAPDAGRFWLLNRILEPEYLAEVKRILAGELVLEEGIDWAAYANARSRNERIRILIDINSARNRCISEGRSKSEFTFVLDGDCYFDKDSWAESVDFISQDQVIHQDCKLYALGLHRVMFGSFAPVHTGARKLEEPIVSFRWDSDVMFDESIPFGQNEKQEFLERVGLIRTGESWSVSSKSICALGGVVRHLQTGDERVEIDFTQRMVARSRSLDTLLERADEVAPEQLASSGQWLALLALKARKLRRTVRKILKAANNAR